MKKLLILLVLPGCGGFTALPREGAIAFKQAVVSMTDQAVWEKLLARVAMHMSHPGMRVSFGTEYYVEMGLINVDGDVRIEGNGVGSGRLSEEAREEILRLSRDGEWERAARLLMDEVGASPPAPDVP